MNIFKNFKRSAYKIFNNMEKKSLRRITVMRHAERVDFTFGSWINQSFDEKGTYIRWNLNMPYTVPERKGGPKDFIKDCPLTCIGLVQATLTGEAMNLCGMKFDHVICSPSLRCVQTCTNVLKASEQTHLKINLEPGLFEWCGWYKSGLPIWMDNQELKSAGFNICDDYKPVIPRSNLNVAETSEEYYMRSFLVTSSLLQHYTGDLLLVGHAGTLDACSRQLIGCAPRNSRELQCLVQKVPYASVVNVEETRDGCWKLMQPPFPALKHCDNSNFDWHILLNSVN